jgi:general secretion pathway protein N
MMGLTLSRRARLGLIALLLFSLIALFPMRLAMGMLGLDRYGVSAREITGSVWLAGMGQLGIGEIPLGTVDAGLSPVSLLLGRARIDVSRQAGQTNDVRGALTAGLGRVGIDDVTGNLPLGAAAAPLPVNAVELTNVSVRFSGGACGAAEGQVRARIAGQIDGLNLSQGLSGTARCDGPALLLPLVSQSGMERLNVRISADGRYTAEMRVTTSDPALSKTLEGQGFSRAGDAFAVRVDGIM